MSFEGQRGVFMYSDHLFPNVLTSPFEFCNARPVTLKPRLSWKKSPGVVRNVYILNTFSIEISTGSEINEDLHDGVEISLETPSGGLKMVLVWHGSL